jgi:DNA-binding NarL/FixJ family response regulator
MDGVPDPDTEAIRVLLMGDYALSRAGLRLLIENHRRMKVVGEAMNSAESLAKISEKPDIILIDVDCGWNVVSELLPNVIAAANGAQVLILMNSPDPEVHCRAVRLGAMGVVPKGKPAEKDKKFKLHFLTGFLIRRRSPLPGCP